MHSVLTRNFTNAKKKKSFLKQYLVQKQYSRTYINRYIGMYRIHQNAFEKNYHNHRLWYSGNVKYYNLTT